MTEREHSDIQPQRRAITIFAPDGIAEIAAGDDLAAVVINAVAADPQGPLQDGDIVVITSKIVSKAEGRVAAAAERETVINSETARTVARRGSTAIVRTQGGLTLAAAGVDQSNVESSAVLLLPVDPDASAARLRAGLQERTGRLLGVIISDTAGRPWRVGQTDQAIGVSGVPAVRAYAGVRDRFGNELRVTAMAVADELAGAADLAKGKLDHRPIAVVRGLSSLVGEPGGTAAELIRPAAADLFPLGSREAVLAAALIAAGRPEAYEDLVRLDPAGRVTAVLRITGAEGAAADLLGRMLSADLSDPAALSPPG
jgi:coenzyme F420-0:L-glutamate ligase/coenzyme F420-1:gamma-L-glutamate ligase